MGGWIKIEKNLTESMRFRRVVRALKDNALRGVTDQRDEIVVSLTVGALVRFWMFADSQIDDDNTLAITLDEINELVGIEGFAQALPADWLQVIDPNHVQLPNFLEHNGSSEKLRRDNARRQSEYRHRQHARNVTRDVTASNDSNDARPDHTRLGKTILKPKNPTASATPSTSQAVTVPRETPDDEPGWWLQFKLAYPDRAGDQGWRKAIRAARARIGEGHHPNEFVAGAARYATFCRATGSLGSEFVKQAATFLGPDKPFLLPWNPPAQKETAYDEIMRLNGAETPHGRTIFEQTAEPSRAALAAPLGNVRR